jgi:hypothetical protein
VVLVARELGHAWQDARLGWQGLPGADKGTVLSAVGLMLCTLLPYVGVPGDPWRPGIVAGGWAQTLLAIWALSLSNARARRLGIAGTVGDLADSETRELRRISLLHLVCGMAATLYSGWLLLLYARFTEVRSVSGDRLEPILRPGLWVSLFFATGLAYAGLARFRADAARRAEG